MARSERPEAAEGPGNAKAGPKAVPSSTRELPMAGLLASSPSQAIAANEFDPRESFYPKTLLTAEDLRGGAPAAKAAAASAPYLADPRERRSPLRWLMVLVLLAAAGGGAYWYFLGEDRSSTVASPSRGGAITPAPAPSKAEPPAAPVVAEPAQQPSAAQPQPHVAQPAPSQAAAPPAPSRARAGQAPRAQAPAGGVTHTHPSAVVDVPAEAPRPSAEVPAQTPQGKKACAPQVAALGLCTP